MTITDFNTVTLDISLADDDFAVSVEYDGDIVTFVSIWESVDDANSPATWLRPGSDDMTGEIAGRESFGPEESGVAFSMTWGPDQFRLTIDGETAIDVQGDLILRGCPGENGHHRSMAEFLELWQRALENHRHYLLQPEENIFEQAWTEAGFRYPERAYPE